MEFREEGLNKLLSEAWREYVKSLESGQVMELESEYREWVAVALEQAVKVKLGAAV